MLPPASVAHHHDPLTTAQVCDDAFDDATDYSHDKAESWNHSIIVCNI